MRIPSMVCTAHLLGSPWNDPIDAAHRPKGVAPVAAGVSSEPALLLFSLCGMSSTVGAMGQAMTASISFSF